MNKIDSFKGKYAFLSNFYEAPVEYDGLKFKNSEAAYQAQKCESYEQRKQFQEMDPSRAKRKGRHVILRHNWDKIKITEMLEIVRCKFQQNEDLKERLLATGDAHLEEGNDWGDTIWGTVNGKGQNNLGKILMQVREELKDKKL